MDVQVLNEKETLARMDAYFSAIKEILPAGEGTEMESKEDEEN